MLDGVAQALLAPPVNVLRLSLHADGLAPRIINLAAWRGHLLARLERRVELTADPVLAALHDELAAYPAPRAAAAKDVPRHVVAPVVPLELASPAGKLTLLGTVTVFGTPLDVSVSELALESFFPADAETAERLRRLTAR